MPGNSAVYQPTTVTYEQQPNDQRWNCPMAYLSSRFSNGLNRTFYIILGLILLAVVMLIAGVAMVVTGSMQATDNTQSLGILLGGAGLLSAGSLLAGSLVYVLGRRGGKEASGGAGGAQLSALNPSTDPLVAAQYVPVRDAPPATDAPDDERRNLMDNKECLSSAEESDKMLEGDRQRPAVA